MNSKTTEFLVEFRKKNKMAAAGRIEQIQKITSKLPNGVERGEDFGLKLSGQVHGLRFYQLLALICPHFVSMTIFMLGIGVFFRHFTNKQEFCQFFCSTLDRFCDHQQHF